MLSIFFIQVAVMFQLPKGECMHEMILYIRTQLILSVIRLDCFVFRFLARRHLL